MSVMITFFSELVADNTHIFIEGSILKIVDLRKASNMEGDNAVYQCKAENKYGYVWANFYLNLLCKFYKYVIGTYWHI